jgi:hypothetical protein
MITLITPTCDRPEAFSLCEFWMSRQTYDGEIQWIVVDDGNTPVCTTQGQEYIRREPGSATQHSLKQNFLEGLKHSKGDKIFVIEDDDYYAPEYIETLANELNNYNLVGLKNHIFYYLSSRSWYNFPNYNSKNPKIPISHLCRTAFNSCLKDNIINIVSNISPGATYVDREIWTNIEHNKNFYNNKFNNLLSIGIKNMPGKSGPTHNQSRYCGLNKNYDIDMSYLKKIIGNDYLYYKKYFGNNYDDVIFYTCLFNKYDELPDTPYKNMYVITDGTGKIGSGWNIINADNPELGSRYYKFYSHELFPDKPTLYFDSNVSWKQNPLDLYKKMWNVSSNMSLIKHELSSTIQDEINLILLNKLDTQQNLNRDIIINNLTEPVYYGTILIRQPTPDVEKFNIQLWNEFKDGYKRDQILIPIFIKNVNYNVVDDISIWNKNPYLNWTKNHLVKRTQF